MQEQLLKCPNCGANVTNHRNCEYCGSLLVRFVEKGIDLTQTTYTSDVEVFPQLKQHLQKTLWAQNTSTPCATDIFREKGKREEAEDGYVLSVLPPNENYWGDGQLMIVSEGDKGLCITLSFKNYMNEEAEIRKQYNELSNARLKRFEQLACFPLFTSHIWDYDCNSPYAKFLYRDLDMTAQEFAIDFGKDIEGAARLISEIMQKVFLIPLTEKIDISTEEIYLNEYINRDSKLERERESQQFSPYSEKEWKKGKSFRLGLYTAFPASMVIAILIINNTFSEHTLLSDSFDFIFVLMLILLSGLLTPILCFLVGYIYYSLSLFISKISKA